MEQPDVIPTDQLIWPLASTQDPDAPAVFNNGWKAGCLTWMGTPSPVGDD